MLAGEVAGAALPSENDLGKRIGVSRTTVRKVLRELTVRGIVVEARRLAQIRATGQRGRRLLAGRRDHLAHQACRRAVHGMDAAGGRQAGHADQRARPGAAVRRRHVRHPRVPDPLLRATGWSRSGRIRAGSSTASTRPSRSSCSRSGHVRAALGAALRDPAGQLAAVGEAGDPERTIVGCWSRSTPGSTTSRRSTTAFTGWSTRPRRTASSTISTTSSPSSSTTTTSGTRRRAGAQQGCHHGAPELHRSAPVRNRRGIKSACRKHLRSARNTLLRSLAK